MLEPQTRRARRSARKSIASRAAAFSLAFSAIALTGLLTAIPAAAATPAASSPAAVAQSAVQTLREISQDAQTALDAARSALTEAATVTADITASGLDVGVADTSVDTADLREAIDRLSAFELVPALLLPDVTEDAADRDASCARRCGGAARSPRGRAGPEGRRRRGCCRGRGGGSGGRCRSAAPGRGCRGGSAAASRARRGSRAALATANTPEGAKAVAAQIASAEYGWGGDQFSCLVSLWDQGVRLELPGVQRVERRHRHPAGAARQQDGQRGIGLADQRRDPDRVGPRLHRGRLRHRRAARGATRSRPAGTDRLDCTAR